MFWHNFSRICVAKGLSPSAVARLANVSPSRASDWKNKGAMPKPETLEKLAEVLGCSVHDFFTTEEDSDAQELFCYYTEQARKAHRTLDIDFSKPANAAGSDPFVEDLLSLYNTLPGREKAQFTLEVYSVMDRFRP